MTSVHRRHLQSDIPGNGLCVIGGPRTIVLAVALAMIAAGYSDTEHNLLHREDSSAA